jgi:hypothetical protein
VKKTKFLPLAVGLAFVGLTVAGCAANTGPAGPSTGPDGKENTGESAAALSPNDPVTMVAIAFYTGGDDKRSNSEVTWQLTLRGITSTYQTDGNTWGNDSWSQYFYARLPAGFRNGDISNLGVHLTEHNGFIQTDDNWNMNQISVWTLSPAGYWSNIANPGGSPLKRFTGSDGQWWWNTWPQ